jgi:muramoyltetrapeptide carboxypeptidase
MDVKAMGNILLIEDLCEPLYHIDRMMQNLRLSGLLEQISGLIVGQFSDITPDSSFAQGAYGIIAEAVKDYHYPVCMNAPFGHVDYHLPLVIGSQTTLTVTA